MAQELSLPQWLQNETALAAVTDVGFLLDQTIESTIQDSSDDYYFDIYTGYSSDLKFALMKIGLLSRHRRLTESDSFQSDGEDTNGHSSPVKNLEIGIRNMIRRDHESGLKFPSHHLLDTDTIDEFRTYLHSALKYKGA
ncbi:uncharacterized protein N7498_009506 [Penicillium cinerascens]|uniref:Uncharacterized protein n=1 Tax=Penicillium cinerascens TaxID=70096 RepID=A0A9W9J797_9EURO|nr:uncharacterized protein N7498_009506 [Penicillium cinerascens]KAJ5190521.1 hypothetical protein N7498_009506 [Penicillium cinerascens]